MNYYGFSANDQRWTNLLISTWQKIPPYFPPKARYKHLRCPKCTRFDRDDMFQEGFDDDIRIRGRGDLIDTDDGFLCINEKVRKIIEDQRFGGFELKPLANTDWHVMNITRRVRTSPDAYKIDVPNYCAVCGRPRGVSGIVGEPSQIELPSEPRTFFSPIVDRSSIHVGRDIFATEEIVHEFKKQGIKGGTFSRVLTAEEEAKYKAAIANKQPLPKVKKQTIIL